MKLAIHPCTLFPRALQLAGDYPETFHQIRVSLVEVSDLLLQQSVLLEESLLLFDKLTDSLVQLCLFCVLGLCSLD